MKNRCWHSGSETGRSAGRRTVVARGVLLTVACLLVGPQATPAIVAESSPEETWWSAPQRPFAVIETVEDLVERHAEVVPVLPATPFVMADAWVVPLPDGEFALYPDDSGILERFAPSGESVARIRPVSAGAGAKQSGALEIRRLDNETLWQSEDTELCDGWLTDELRFIGRNAWQSPLALTFWSQRGELVRRLSPVFQDPDATGEVVVLAKAHVVLAWHAREVVALSEEGDVLWRFRCPAEEDGAAIAQPGLDPFHRGVYIPVVHGEDRTTSIELVDAATGKSTGAVWRHKAIPLPCCFTSQGYYAAFAGRSGVGAIDWQRGELLLFKRRTEEPDVWLAYPEAIDLADSPPDLAVSLGGGETVFDLAGRRIWQTQVRGIGERRIWISRDARLGAVVACQAHVEGGLRVKRLLLYKLRNW